MDELRPCPFCGVEPEVHPACEYEAKFTALFLVACDKCGARGDYYIMQADAIKAWNTRHENICHPKDKGEHLSGTDCPAWECSECGELFEAGVNFCSNCGARVIS